jgi:hypothetical protein
MSMAGIGVAMTYHGCLPARLTDLDLDEIMLLWSKTFRSAPPMRLKRELLLRLLAYAAQERAHGSLPRASVKSLTTFAGAEESGPAKAWPEQQMSALRIGARLVRSWNGVTHEVTVLKHGFAYRGNRYRSLSEVAEVITGTHWSGPRFFGLRKLQSTPAEKESA